MNQAVVPLSEEELSILCYALIHYPDPSDADKVSELLAKLYDFRG